MAKDYAHAKAKTTPQPSNRSLSQTVAMWLSTILLIFLFALGLFFLSHQDQIHEMQKPFDKIAHTVKPAVKKAPQTKFEFYHILTNEHGRTEHPAEISAQDERALQTAKSNHREMRQSKVIEPRPTTVFKPPPRKTIEDRSHSYYLQVASFKENQDAESLKAKLSLAGFTVTIQRSEVNDRYWHRVFVGPYRERSEALAAQETLERYRLKSILKDLG